MLAGLEFNTTCDIYAGWASGMTRSTGTPCRLVPDLPPGRRRVSSAPLTWTHVLLLQPDVAIRDACTRTAGSPEVSYADGDEVRIPSGSTNKFVTVWVEVVNDGLPTKYKRVYLTRDAVDWSSSSYSSA